MPTCPTCHRPASKRDGPDSGGLAGAMSEHRRWLETFLALIPAPAAVGAGRLTPRARTPPVTLTARTRTRTCGRTYRNR
jgi:hypothetical protein